MVLPTGQGSGSGILEIIGMLIVFAAVLFVAWLTTKLLGKKLSGSSKNKAMKIVETLQIGMDRCLYLIKVGNKYFLFNASRKSLDMVSEIEIDEESLTAGHDENDNGRNAFDFKRIFEFYSGLGKRGKNAEPGADSEEHPEVSSDTETGGLSANIKRLRRMTGGGERYKG